MTLISFVMLITMKLPIGAKEFSSLRQGFRRIDIHSDQRNLGVNRKHNVW
jgi:hypothetical protein